VNEVLFQKIFQEVQQDKNQMKIYSELGNVRAK